MADVNATERKTVTLTANVARSLEFSNTGKSTLRVRAVTGVAHFTVNGAVATAGTAEEYFVGAEPVEVSVQRKAKGTPMVTLVQFFSVAGGSVFAEMV